MTEQTSELLSVVIITMNRRALVEQSVPILLGDPATGEVIVVIDGGRDGTLEMLEQWAIRDERVRPIWQENAGADAARQQGAESARFDVVVFLDDDVMPLADLVTQHAHRHRVGDVDMVLGYMPTTVPTPRHRGQVATILYASDYEATCRIYEANPENIWVHFWAGNFSLRRDKAVSIGLRGQHRLNYHEDLYFGIRCKDSGLKAAFDRLAQGRHTHSRNLRSLAREARSSGEARGTLVNWYPILVEHLDPLSSRGGLIRRAALIVSIPPSRAVAVPVLMAGSWFFGLVHVWPLETFAAQVMRQIDLVHSYRSRLNSPVVARKL